MLSSIATHEPLPFVPPTITVRYGGGFSSRRSRTSVTRPRLMSIFFGCSVSSQASQSSSERPRRSGVTIAASFAGSARRGPVEQLREQRRDLIARLPPVDDHVDRALLEQELGALETFGQRLAGGLLDHARPGEADQRA